mgnify:CR=1 FL=1
MVEVIPNSVSIRSYSTTEKIPFEYVIAVGRLVQLKQFDKLIESYANSNLPQKNIHLVILGTGEEQDKLEKKILDLKIETKVHLLGFKENPYPYLAKADLYVCSSFTEGYNSAIIEALALEIPVLTTDCPGMNEILDKGKFGKIVPNTTEDLYKGLVELITKSEELNLLKLKAKERAVYLKAQNSTRSVEHLFDTI